MQAKVGSNSSLSLIFFHLFVRLSSELCFFSPAKYFLFGTETATVKVCFWLDYHAAARDVPLGGSLDVHTNDLAV